MKVVMVHSNKYIHRFLKSQRMTEEQLQDMVKTRLDFLKDCPEKIKAVGPFHYQGYIVLEFRLSAGCENYRIAYIESKNHYEVLYASTTLLKKDFIREFDRCRF